MALHNKFNITERGHGYQLEEKLNKGDGRKPFICWICGGDHRKRDFPSHQGGRPQICNAHMVDYS